MSLPLWALLPRKMHNRKHWRSHSGCEYHGDCQREPQGCDRLRLGFWQSSGTIFFTLSNIWWPWPFKSLPEESCYGKKETKWWVFHISISCSCMISMISKQLILSQMGLGWAFPGRSRLDVIHLDLTRLKRIDFLTALRSPVYMGAYSPVKGHTLLLCPELKRDFGYCHFTTLFFLIWCNKKKFGLPWALIWNFTQLY